MKRIFAMLLLCALALSFSACKKTEITAPMKSSAYSANDLAEPEISSEPPVLSSYAADSAVDQRSETPQNQSGGAEFIDDIHEWDENNVLYNINETYEITDRYYIPFEWVEQRAALWRGTGNVPALNKNTTLIRLSNSQKRIGTTMWTSARRLYHAVLKRGSFP